MIKLPPSLEGETVERVYGELLAIKQQAYETKICLLIFQDDPDDLDFARLPALVSALEEKISRLLRYIETSESLKADDVV